MAKKTEPTRKVISVDELVLDAGTQSRAAIDEETVEDYAEVLAQTKGTKWPFPEIDVFHDGSRYLVSSGFHRTLAARRHGRASIPCLVYKGTAWDAFLSGIHANSKNPLRPNREDRKFMVERLIQSGEFVQTDICAIVGVSIRTVQRISAEMRTPDPPNGGLDDPFDVEDPFGLSGSGEEDGTDSGGQEDQELPPPDANGNGTETSGGPSRTPAEEFKIQKAKTVKTAEALMRAFADLHALKKSPWTEERIDLVKDLIGFAQNWPK
jgi:hypothetical protein